ncbi:RHS repeat-associated core domain-containing protein [Streptomyces sp. NPDC015220]|uniref:RHS repeat-associated core domain-containing protein n=1 Tax=Streptomyces sp. NPDC015220 TaxID=3364947 RepID=UPI0036FBE820
MPRSAQHTHTHNDTDELTSYDTDSGFTHDGTDNETGAASPTGTRTAESWTPSTQLAAYTQSGATTHQTYAGTDNTQRLTRDATTFTNAAVGITGQSMTGTATSFVHEPSGTLVAMRTGGNSQYHLTDAHNTVIGLLDTTGKRTAAYTYGPYGEQRTNTSTQQPFRYTSAYPTPSKPYKTGARYNDPGLGRFTQPDPSGTEPNTYLYGTAHPVNYTRPAGTSVLGCIAGDLSVAGEALSLGAGTAGPIGSGGLSTPPSLAAIRAGLGFIGSGLAMHDSRTS